ncbi:MAG: DUF3124 domain-containing protein [Sandaracinaceae bacterium]
MAQLPRVPAARALVALLALCLTGCPDPVAEPPPPSAPVVEPPTPSPPRGEVRTRYVYVPAYSQLGTREAHDLALFSITLSVRNVEPATDVTLTHVDYFDTSGHLVRRYLRAPRTLAPLESAEFSVATQDETGGSGANFLVYWEGPSDAHPLLTETVMRTGYIAFTSRGVELDRVPDTVDADSAEADTVDTDAIETDTVEADTVEADTVEADTVEADTEEETQGALPDEEEAANEGERP